MDITVKPVAVIRNSRHEPVDDDWGTIQSEIHLEDYLPTDSLDGIDTHSHLEIVFYFHKVADTEPVLGARHPRNSPAFPKVGIFAQRRYRRPNFIGCTIVRLIRREGRILIVDHLDAIDGTPVLDIKPVLKEFLPKGEIRQPAWADEIMSKYW